MKTTRFVLVALFIMLTNTIAYADCGGGGCSSGNDSCSSCSSCSNPNPCGCADPTCYSGNPCLSQSDCCSVFGNIGSSNQSIFDDD